MTDKKKQELRQLLEEAMGSLGILLWTRGSLSVSKYGKQLRERWASYSAESKSVYDFTPNIVSEKTKLKLRAFIRSELEQFINEDRILSATYYVMGGSSEGAHLNSLLTQLLRITIGWGIEEAVLAFDGCTKNTHASMQCVALLEGIKIEEAIQAFKGVRLVPVPDSPSVCSSYLPRIPFHGISEDFYYSQTLLIIDYTISPMFHKPVLPPVAQSEKELFRIEVSGGELPDFNEQDFFQEFCGALSLACNSPVLISMKWDLLAEDEIFNVRQGVTDRGAHYLIPGLFGKSTEVGESDIEKAKCLYRALDKKSDIKEKLHIPIDRWIRSKETTTYSVDQIIDLGIAFEVLYLSRITDNRELSFRLRLHAAWHLGKDKEHRKELLKKFGQIYECRSKAVHSGTFDRLPKFGAERIPISDFIEKAQDLCRESIIKIIEDEEFPDGVYWNNLILGGDKEQVSS